MSSVSPLDPLSDEALRIRLNQETARIPWHELQRHYARGQVARVATELDLVEVALTLIRDDRARVDGWMAQSLLGEVSVEQAQAWYRDNQALWAVVVAPWVLVQDRPG